MNLEKKLRYPEVSVIGIFVCIEVALFSLVAMSKLPMPALWWAALSVPPTLLLTWLLRSKGFPHMAQFMGMWMAGFCGGALGAHGRLLYCMVLACM